MSFCMQPLFLLFTNFLVWNLVGTIRNDSQLVLMTAEAAFFVQHVVAAYERYFLGPQSVQQPAKDRGDTAGSGSRSNDETIGKECTNLMVLLSELYNFRVISCALVYDIIRGLLDGELTEFKAELLLKVTRSETQM